MDEPTEISVDEAKRILDGGEAIFIDVRDPMSYRMAHVPGALHVTDQNVEEFVTATPKGKKLVVYCYHGYVSIGGAGYFRAQGFTDVCSMEGGFEAWRATQACESGL